MEPHEVDDIIRHLVRIAAQEKNINARRIKKVLTLRARMIRQGENGKDA